MKKIENILKPIAALLVIILIIVSFNINGKKEIVKINIGEENRKTEIIDIDTTNLNKMIKDKKTFVLFTYNNYCSFTVPCDMIIETTMKNLNLKLYEIPFTDYKNSSIYSKVKYAPSVIIIQDGEVKYYLDANDDNDTKYYQDVNELTNWLNERLK